MDDRTIWRVRVITCSIIKATDANSECEILIFLFAKSIRDLKYESSSLITSLELWLQRRLPGRTQYSNQCDCCGQPGRRYRRNAEQGLDPSVSDTVPERSEG